MNHIFRLLFLLLSSPFRQEISFKDKSITQFRVWFTDLDVLMHMNNGVYLSLLDLGRVDFMSKTGTLKKVQKAGIYPVVAAEAIKFKRSLKLFDKFEIHTSYAGADEKYIYLEQNYWSKGKLCASAIIKGKFLKKSGGKLDSKELLEVIGYTGKLSPNSHIKQFSEAIDENFKYNLEKNLDS